jgi:hypothetical protein
VCVVWEPMLVMSMVLVQASLRDAVGISGGAVPPVNWRAIIGGPSGTSCVGALALSSNVPPALHRSFERISGLRSASAESSFARCTNVGPGGTV